MLATFLPHAWQIIAQTQRRILQGEQLPPDKMNVSIFEPHTDIIRRGKARQPTEYSHKVWLGEVKSGIIAQ